MYEDCTIDDFFSEYLVRRLREYVTYLTYLEDDLLYGSVSEINSLSENNSGIVIIFNIYKLKQATTRRQLDSFAIHELTHVKQIEDGRLHSKHDGEGRHAIIFDSVEYLDTEDLSPREYIKLPWEVEAYEEQFKHSHGRRWKEALLRFNMGLPQIPTI